VAVLRGSSPPHHGVVESPGRCGPAGQEQQGRTLTKGRMRLQRSNKALKLTTGAEVRAPRHSASLHRSSVPRSTFFTNVPSQLNAVLGRPYGIFLAGVTPHEPSQARSWLAPRRS
jgi:hypothetical protein